MEFDYVPSHIYFPPLHLERLGEARGSFCRRSLCVVINSIGWRFKGGLAVWNLIFFPLLVLVQSEMALEEGAVYSNVKVESEVSMKYGFFDA